MIRKSATDRKEGILMHKLDELLETVKENAALLKKEEKKDNTLLWVLAVIGAIAAIAGIAYAIYRYLSPSYLEGFEDEFEDDFEEDEDSYDFLEHGPVKADGGAEK